MCLCLDIFTLSQLTYLDYTITLYHLYFFQVGTISLSSTNYDVEESAGSVIVSVELVGGEVDDVVEVR